MKNIEKEIIGNDMKNYINFVKKNLKRKMKKGEKYDLIFEVKVEDIRSNINEQKIR